MSAARKTDSSGSSVGTDSSTPGDGIHKCDTVPPPEGESDAYNAVTKIGAMPSGYVDQLMAQAEVMSGGESAPKSGERPLAARKPLPSDPPAVVAAPAAIPRIYDASDDGDQLDPTSLFPEGQQQSGATKLLALDVASIAPPPAAASSAPPTGTPSIAEQLVAYRQSTRPARETSDTKLVLAVCVVVAVGLAALYFIFLAA